MLRVTIYSLCHITDREVFVEPEMTIDWTDYQSNDKLLTATYAALGENLVSLSDSSLWPVNFKRGRSQSRRVLQRRSNVLVVTRH